MATALPPGFTLDPPQKAQQGPALPPGFTLDNQGSNASQQEPDLVQKAMRLLGIPGSPVTATAAEFLKGLVEGTVNIPKNYFDAAAQRPPGATGVTPQMVEPAAAAALLATTGKSPFAAAGADTAALAGVGARTGEARAAGQAAVEDAVRPPGPWDAGGTALTGQVQGQRAVANALSTPQAPVSSAPGGAQPPPMPPEVAGALDQSLGPAQIPRTPIPEPVGPPRPSEITPADRAEADALLGREAAQRGETGRATPADTLAQDQGQAAVQRAMQAPGWIKTPAWIRENARFAADFANIMEDLTTRAQRRAAPLRGPGGDLLSPEAAVGEAVRKAVKAPGWLRTSPEPVAAPQTVLEPAVPPPTPTIPGLPSAPRDTSIPAVAQTEVARTPEPIAWEPHNINIATALTALLHGHPMAAAASLAIRAWARAHPQDAAGLVRRVASPSNVQRILRLLGLTR